MEKVSLWGLATTVKGRMLFAIQEGSDTLRDLPETVYRRKIIRNEKCHIVISLAETSISL